MRCWLRWRPKGEALLTRSGVRPSEITHRRDADMRYVGQGHEIRVPLPAGALDAIACAGAGRGAFATSIASCMTGSARRCRWK